ncbi:FlgD immunoglobulin-like domain containing protein [Streptomyces xantholiticus]|uniref:FlgD immunoglobulin-like domain containing protein n=1 Tax=Streptomyces xantholiticus TaxID=68285 RepID=UPI00167B7993|nr:FlgD immunoglobulin-like domain containing protein [Streptomyces xantholiticus]
MPRSALLRHSIAAVAATALFAGIGPLAPVAAAADGDSIVLPAAAAAQPRDVVPLAAGPNGYLRYEQGAGQFWTTWDGRTTPVVNDQEGPEAGGVHGAGSDIVAALDFDGPSIYGDVRLWDVTAGTNRYLTIPDQHRYVGTFGDKVVTYTRSSLEAPNEWHVLRLVNGSVQDTLVTGWPEGSARPARAAAGDADGALTRYVVNGVSRPVWIDLTSGQARPVPTDVTAETVNFVHTPTEVVEWTKDGKVRFYAKGEAGSSGPLTLTSTTELPHNDGDVLLGVVGERLIVARLTGEGGSAPYRVVSLPKAGGEETTLFAYGRKHALAAPDGGLLIVAGSSAGDLGLQRIRPEGAGTTDAELVDVAPLTSKPRRFGFSHGQLESLERMPDESNSFLSRSVSVTGALSAGATKERGDFGVALDECTESSGCPEVFATGDGRTVVQPAPGSAGKPLVVAPDGTDGVDLAPGFESFQVTDVSGRYAVGSGFTGPDYDTYVPSTAVDLDTGKRLGTFPVGYDPQDVDLYGDTLWAAGKVNGTVVGYDVRTGAAKRTVDLKSGCRAEAIKVTAHWLSWNCAGLPARGGVFDLDTNTNRTYTEPFSDLGDGYVVQGDGSEVTVTDVRGSEPVAKGTYQLSEFNHETGPYAVDTATGRLAYQENAAGDVRVVDLGVPASPLARIDADVPVAQATDGGKSPWTPRWWLSKPAASWQLEITDPAGGPVRTVQGGEARGVIAAAWDGKDAEGRIADPGTYHWTLKAAPADGAGPELELKGSMALEVGAGTYEPVTPTRSMDTRTGLGVPKAKVGAGQTVTLQVTGRSGIPASGVTAVVMNVTATTVTGTTYVSVYPNGTQRTSASNLNVTAGETRPNLVVVPVVNGKVSFYNNAGSVNLIADVAGYFTAEGSGSTYEPVTPTRFMDTRTGLGVPQAKVGAGQTVTLQVTGKHGLPASGVTGVVMNVTGTTATATTYVSAYPNGTTRTSASSLNLVAGQTAPNLVVVPVVNGKVSFYNNAGSVNLIADVAGYFTSAGDGSEYRPLTPTRFMDTRTGLGVPQAKVGAGQTVTLQVTGRNGVPATGVTAVVMNVTGTTVTGTTYVSVYPNGTTRTSASNLNLVAGQTAPNLVVVPVVNGKVSFYNNAGSVNLVADVAGYYTG